jgi:hypothetical protein
MPTLRLFFMLFTMASVGLPGTSNFVGEFLALAGIYEVSTWAALIGTTGIILGAAYMLYLYRRVVFGELTKDDVRAMPDLSAASSGCSRRSPRGAVDGRLSRKLPRADAQDVGTLVARLEPTRPAGTRSRSAGQARARARSTLPHMLLRRGGALMDYAQSVLMVCPRWCSPWALILMLVAAYAGDKATKLVSWLRSLVLAGAGRARRARLIGGRRGFHGLYRADGFAAFAKALVYIAAAVSILIAPTLLPEDVRRRSARRISGADPALSVGMGMMVSAGDLLTLYVGLELQQPGRLCPCQLHAPRYAVGRSGPEIFRARRAGLGILLYGISLVYGFTGTTLFDGIADAYARRPVDRRDVRPGIRDGRPRLQDQRGAVPHVDARRVRRRADAGDGLLRLGAQGRGDGADRPRRGRGDGPGDRSVAADRDLCRTWPRSSSVRSRRSARPTSSGCSPIRRSTMSALH